MSTNNRQVAHAWAHGQAAKGSNFKSDGVTLTSYYTTIAAHIDDVFYISSDSMSVSTGKHIGYARQALGWNDPRIFSTSAFSWGGSNPALTHESMIQPAARSAVQTLENALTHTKTRQKTKMNAIQAYIQERERITTHAAKFGVTVSMPEVTAGPESIKEYQEAKRIAEEKKEAIRLKAVKKQQREDKAQYNLWLTTGAGRYPRSFITRGADQITIKQDKTIEALSPQHRKIITSQGAECPLDHAIKALKFYNSRRIDFQDLQPVFESYHTNGHKIPLGIFTLDSIDEAGTVKAGCHTFSAAEIQRFIAQWREVLGL